MNLGVTPLWNLWLTQVTMYTWVGVGPTYWKCWPLVEILFCPLTVCMTHLPTKGHKNTQGGGSVSTFSPWSINKHALESKIAIAGAGRGPRVVVSTAAFHARVRGSVPGMFLPHPRVKVSIVWSLRDREVASSASDRQGSNFESCVWRTVSSQSSHHPQEVLLAQFSLYVHKGGLKPDSFHFFIAGAMLGLRLIRN